MEIKNTNVNAKEQILSYCKAQFITKNKFSMAILPQGLKDAATQNKVQAAEIRDLLDNTVSLSDLNSGNITQAKMASAVLITIVLLKPNLPQGGKVLTAEHIVNGSMDIFSQIDVSFVFKFSITSIEKLLRKTTSWLTNPREYKPIANHYREYVLAKMTEIAAKMPSDSDLSRDRFIAKQLCVVTERRTRKDEVIPYLLPTTTNYDSVWSAHLTRNGQNMEFVYKLSNLKTETEESFASITDAITCMIDSKSILCTYPTTKALDGEFYQNLLDRDIAKELKDKEKSTLGREQILNNYFDNVFRPTMLIQRQNVPKGDLLNNHQRLYRRYGNQVHLELFGEDVTKLVIEEMDKRKFGRLAKKKGKNPRRNIEEMRQVYGDGQGAPQVGSE